MAKCKVPCHFHTHPKLALQQAGTPGAWRQVSRTTAPFHVVLPARSKLQITEEWRAQIQRRNKKGNSRRIFTLFKTLETISYAKTCLLRGHNGGLPYRKNWETVPWPVEMIVPRGRSPTRLSDHLGRLTGRMNRSLRDIELREDGMTLISLHKAR